ncbi:MAG: hypothetical protein KTR26_09275 [Flammeovirgaceae bacterium]|nr:hypothetical protein [Flammeovirgaceae bacterium]
MDHLDALSFFDADTETSLEEIENRYKIKRTTFNTLLSRTTSDHFEKIYTGYINNIDAAFEVVRVKQKKTLWGKLSLATSEEVAEKVKVKVLKDFVKSDGSFDTEGFKNYGEKYFRIGKFKDAFPLFHKLNSLEPTNIAIKFRVTECRIIYAEMKKLRLEKEKEEKIKLEKERKVELERLKQEKQAELERREQEQKERLRKEEARLEQERKKEEEKLAELQKLEDSLLSGVDGLNMESDSLESALVQQPKGEEGSLLMELKRLEQEIGNSGASYIREESSFDYILKEIEQQEEDKAEKDKKDLEALEAENQNSKKSVAFIDKVEATEEVENKEGFFQATKKRALFLILLFLFISLQFFAFSKKSSNGLLAGLSGLFNKEEVSDFDKIKSEAELLYKDGNYVEALSKFEMALEKLPENEYIKERIDLCKVLLTRQNDINLNNGFDNIGGNNLDPDFAEENWDELEEIPITQDGETPKEKLN